MINLIIEPFDIKSIDIIYKAMLDITAHEYIIEDNLSNKHIGKLIIEDGAFYFRTSSMDTFDIKDIMNIWIIK